MLLTLATTHRPATDLGFLLAKNPARFQTFDLTFGKASVFYPEASEARCEAALLLEVDPVRLIRGSGARGAEGLLDRYVNDRPYAASSFLSVALAQVYASALGGRSRERPGLAESALPLEARIPALPARGGEALLTRLFEPLGHTVDARRRPLDPAFPAWGESAFFDVTLRFEGRLRDLLAHLYVLVPVLDDEKHYYVGEAEVEKLLKAGEGWLATHPEKDLIAHRYLVRKKRLAREALARLAEEDGEPDPDTTSETRDAAEQAIERPLSLNEQRIATVVATMEELGARRVLDLGCGEGRLLAALLASRSFTSVVGLDVSARALEIAADRLHLDRLPEKQRARVQLLHGSLTYRDARLAGFDAAAVVEVIEHLDPHRLGAFSRALLGEARPKAVVLTTPNVEYNVRFESLPAGKRRHRDHRFEWTRAELRAWAEGEAAGHGYDVRFAPVGPEDLEVGPPTQMAVFTRRDV